MQYGGAGVFIDEHPLKEVAVSPKAASISSKGMFSTPSGLSLAFVIISQFKTYSATPAIEKLLP